MDCSICFDNITYENCVKYKVDGVWNDFNACNDCIIHMIKTMGTNYLNEVKKIDCEKSLKALLINNIPTHLTCDFTYYGKKIEELYYNGQLQTSYLTYNPEINIDLLSEQLYILYNQILSDETFDYIGYIKNIFENVNL